jgi:hypothetical protein
LRNALRLDRRANPSLDTVFARLKHRETILSRTHDHRNRDLRQRYEAEESVQSQAQQLFNQYGTAGATWAACVQAVKTSWVGQFTMKWSQRAPTKST